MYAFVNFRTTEEAIAAFDTLQGLVIPELTGDRPLLLKYRPVSKAAAKLRALGLGEEGCLGEVLDDRPSVERPGLQEPSPRIWLGNIASSTTAKALQAVLSRFGPLLDAAVFPARIGPLGYAFVKFERLADAVAAFGALNNTVVPLLSGGKQLKMRYKPAGDGPSEQEGLCPPPGEGMRGGALVASRHLWLGNINQRPSDQALVDLFSPYGRVDSVRVFPLKAYAFVNFAEVGAAGAAMAAMDGVVVPTLTGLKPLVMRYQQEPAPGTGRGAPAGGLLASSQLPMYDMAASLAPEGLWAGALGGSAGAVGSVPSHSPSPVLSYLGLAGGADGWGHVSRAASFNPDQVVALARLLEGGQATPPAATSGALGSGSVATPLGPASNATTPGSADGALAALAAMLALRDDGSDGMAGPWGQPPAATADRLAVLHGLRALQSRLGAGALAGAGPGLDWRGGGMLGGTGAVGFRPSAPAARHDGAGVAGPPQDVWPGDALHGGSPDAYAPLRRTGVPLSLSPALDVLQGQGAGVQPDLLPWNLGTATLGQWFPHPDSRDSWS